MGKKQQSKKFGRRYPWAAWFAAGKVVLRRGRDYTCQSHCLGVMARTAASRLGYKLHVQINEDSRNITLVAEEGPYRVQDPTGGEDGAGRVAAPLLFGY